MNHTEFASNNLCTFVDAVDSNFDLINLDLLIKIKFDLNNIIF